MGRVRRLTRGSWRRLPVRGAPVRAVTVVGLVLGIALMHGLGPGGHVDHAVPRGAVSVAPLAGPAHGAFPAHVGHGRAAAVMPGAGTHGAAASALPAHAAHLVAAGAGMCLAVLLTALLLQRRDRSGPALPARTDEVPVVVAGTRPPGRGPPGLLLTRLCVLRT